MTCNFISFLTVFQLYQDNGWVIMKYCMHQNLFHNCKESCLQQVSNPEIQAIDHDNIVMVIKISQLLELSLSYTYYASLAQDRPERYLDFSEIFTYHPAVTFKAKVTKL